MTNPTTVLSSLSAAMDGGFVAIADVSTAIRAAGAADAYRLIGGVMVMLHVERLGLDLLVPTYRSRARDTVTIGDVVTTEVPGLAEALRRLGYTIDGDLWLTDGTRLAAAVVLPDAVGILALKTLVRSVRDERRDVEDLWRCLEIAGAEEVTPSTFDGDRPLEHVREVLWQQLRPSGSALPQLTEGLQEEPAARLRTRVRAPRRNCRRSDWFSKSVRTLVSGVIDTSEVGCVASFAR